MSLLSLEMVSSSHPKKVSGFRVEGLTLNPKPYKNDAFCLTGPTWGPSYVVEG